MNISLVFITQSYFSVPKDVTLNSTHYLIMKINNRKELHHSADIDYNNFVRIYIECTKEPYSYLTIDTTLPASKVLLYQQVNLEKVCFFLIKTTVPDQIKILDRKIKQN